MNNLHLLLIFGIVGPIAVTIEAGLSPGRLACATVGLVGEPAVVLGTCGAYVNRNASESPIMDPDELCRYFCNGDPGAFCKQNLYCSCPNTPITATPPTWCFNASNYLLSPRGPSSAAITTCEKFCSAELKTEYFCFSPIPRQINQEFCVCAAPPTDIAVLPNVTIPSPTFYSLLPTLLGILPLPLLPNSLYQSVISFLTPFTDIVCTSVSLLDGPAGSIKTCYTFDNSTTNITCAVAADQNPACFCQQFCPNSDAVCTSAGSCTCNMPPSRQYCGRASSGTQSTICKGLCPITSVPYTCANEYCVCAPF